MAQQYPPSYTPTSQAPSMLSEVGSAVSAYCQYKVIAGAVILLCITMCLFYASYKKTTTEETVYLKTDAVIVSTYVLSGKQRKGTKNNYY